MTALERSTILPEQFARWFESRGWTPRAHQLELLDRARAGRSVLLIAPTGGGKTLAGFLPTLVELSGTSPPMRSSPLPPRSGGEGSGVGGFFCDDSPPPRRFWTMLRIARIRRPSPPLASARGGRERKFSRPIGTPSRHQPLQRRADATRPMAGADLHERRRVFGASALGERTSRGEPAASWWRCHVGNHALDGS